MTETTNPEQYPNRTRVMCGWEQGTVIGHPKPGHLRVRWDRTPRRPSTIKAVEVEEVTPERLAAFKAHAERLGLA